MVLPQLRRVRWAVRATLVLGVAASVVANILHALDNPISQAIAAWPPLALLLTVELISRVPVHRRSLAVARLVATATIAGIAAWVSYWHMAGVAARYGEIGASPYLLPLSVDGLIVVASICLVELGGRIASLESESHATARAARAAAESAATVAADAATRTTPVEPESPVAIPGLIPTPATASAPVRRSTAAALAEVAAALPSTAFTPTMTRQPRAGVPAAAKPRAAGAAKPTRTRSGSSRTGKREKVRRTPADTVSAATRIKAERPGLTEAQLAAELGISASRWRTIRREAAQAGDLRLAA